MSSSKVSVGGGGSAGAKKGNHGFNDIPSGSRKIVQSLKEIVNSPEAEIYAMLKECNMDPNEAVNRLLSQDPFHEVKSKKEKKKERRQRKISEERNQRKMEKSGGRKVMDELKSFEKASLFDLGHPLLNRIADSFVKAAGVGALQAVSREAYFTVVDGAGFDSRNVGAPSENTGSKKHRFPNLRGESSKSLEALVKNTGKESLQWGLAAGLYSGITYGMKEARGGAHDWRNSAVAGALTGAAMAMTTSERTSHEQVVQSALTGAAISAAANLLSSVF